MRIVSLYYRHRFPAEIISHCVWLYFRFSLSFRDVEELMSSRGVSLSYETVHRYLKKTNGHQTNVIIAATMKAMNQSTKGKTSNSFTNDRTPSLSCSSSALPLFAALRAMLV